MTYSLNDSYSDIADRDLFPEFYQLSFCIYDILFFDNFKIINSQICENIVIFFNNNKKSQICLNMLCFKELLRNYCPTTRSGNIECILCLNLTELIFTVILFLVMTMFNVYFCYFYRNMYSGWFH